MRPRPHGTIVPDTATGGKREIRDQDVRGLKCLRKIRPLLSRLRKVGTERDRAGNRGLFMDQYCALRLMALFSPAIQSLRDLQRAWTPDKVRKRLGVNLASPGGLVRVGGDFRPRAAEGDRGGTLMDTTGQGPARRRRRPAKPGGPERSHLRASGGQDDRGECPARGRGRPRATPDAGRSFLHLPCRTGLASCLPLPR